MSTLRQMRSYLVAVSRRYSRVGHEVEDLAHDLVVSALRRGSTLDSEAVLRTAHGAARRHAAFLARSAGRRRSREVLSAREDVSDGEVDPGHDADEGTPMSVLSPTLQTTLLLLLLGLEKGELCLALGVTDTALRKRFQALREHGPLARPDLPVPRRTEALSRLRRSQVGLLPRLADALEVEVPARRVLATSDPDGHGLIFAEVLTTSPCTATSDASTVDRTRRRGNPC
jgi:DNA-directed RNA polymerase specialized sigma24 family protein